MNISFKYVEEKDTDCLLEFGPGSLNSPGQMTDTYVKLLKEGVDIKDIEQVKGFVRAYIADHKLDMVSIAKVLQQNWNSICGEYSKVAEKIFGESIDYEVTAYITITCRYPYSLDKKYFFVSTDSDANSIVMHEMWHFYTWQKFGESVYNKLGSEKYNTCKESLTVLLNSECSFLMNGKNDLGYPQHQSLRKMAEAEWIKTHDINKVWQVLEKNVV